MPMDLRPLAPSEHEAARALLEASDLPTDDLADSSIHLMAAFDAGVLVGVVRLQRAERSGLLRSLAVAPQARCERVIDLASKQRLEGLWLLTTSARDYFARLG